MRLRFTPLDEAASALPSGVPADAAFKHATTLDNDEQEPIQQDDAPPLGLPTAGPFAWTLERLGPAPILTDLALQERDLSRRSPRGPPA